MLRAVRQCVAARMAAAGAAGCAAPGEVVAIASRGLETSLVPGPGGRHVSAEIAVIPRIQQVEIGKLLEGDGTVGFDDVEVSALSPVRL